jgi:hypothetical protein
MQAPSVSEFNQLLKSSNKDITYYRPPCNSQLILLFDQLILFASLQFVKKVPILKVHQIYPHAHFLCTHFSSFLSFAMAGIDFVQISTERGGHRFLYLATAERALFHVKTTKPNGARYMRCVEQGCPARGRIHHNIFTRTNNARHNHVTPTVQAEFEQAYERLRETVRNDRRREIRAQHREALRSISAPAGGFLSWESVRMTLQRIRAEQMPPCRDLEALIDLLETNEEVYNSYGVIRGAPFYHGAANGHLVFANRELVDQLGEEFEMSVDATFGVTPFRAYQLLVVMGHLQGKPRPIAYAVMTGKSMLDYIAVFTLLKDGVFRSYGVSRVPTVVMCDFEIAMRRALVEVWRGVNVVGCHFHFCQALRRKAASLQSLSIKILEDCAHRSVLHMYMRLPLLPTERIDAGYHALVEYTNSIPRLARDFAAFNDYFESTWRRRYPKEEWGVSEYPRRTNNHIEGYNNFIKLTFPKNPDPWSFLDRIGSLAYDASASYHSHLRRNVVQFADRSNLTVPFREALRDLTANRINEFEFLRVLSEIH